MPEITPEQALCALMLGTGETELILDPEVIRAVQGVQIEVVWAEFKGDLMGSGQARDLWTLRFKGMPDPKLLEQKGMRIPDVPAGWHLGAKAHDLGSPTRDSLSHQEKYGVPLDPGPRPPEVRRLSLMAGTFEIYQDKGKKYRLRLKDEHGNIVAASPIKDSWDDKAGAHAQVEKIRGALTGAQVVDG